MSTPPVTIITPRGKLIALAVVCALFAVMGVIVLAVNPTATLNLIVGVGAIAFFGLGGGISVVSQWRRSTVVVADDTGLRIRGAGTVAWADVDRIGADATTLGIRLRNAAAFAERAPATYTAESLRSSRAATGWDITWPSAVLDRPARDAAAALQARRPV